MSTLNLNANINGAKRGLPYPTAGLEVIVYNSTYEDGGTTYYRTSKGIGLPVISGTGLDTIIDFSVLLVGGKKDLRFNKNAYVGSSYTDDEGNPLPANYNFPFVGIYYDSANPYYWKITDFAYAVILAQSLLVDNMFFLKAKATTNTSNIIASWTEFLVYSVAQTSTNLTKLKTYIGIQDDFYGNELSTNNNLSTWSTRGTLASKDDNGFVADASGEGVTFTTTVGLIYKISFTYTTNADSGQLGFWHGNVSTLIAILTDRPAGTYSDTITALQSFVWVRMGGVATVGMTNVSVKIFYQNYYTS